MPKMLHAHLYVVIKVLKPCLINNTMIQNG